MASAADVLSGRARYCVEAADCLAWLPTLPADSVDLAVFSPPYELARLYLEGGKNLSVARATEEWVAWMVQVFTALSRVCKGLIACVCEGQTKNYRYSCGPFLLMADLCRAGFNLRKPPIYRRVGIPGSGGPDWWRNDYEPIICVTRPGKLPWSDNVATGAPPKYAPGGKMTNRLKNGKRVHERNFKDLGKNGHLKQSYTVPDTANPGNVIRHKYTAKDVGDFLGGLSDMVDCQVGGGKMGEGSVFAREGEAPFPEQLVEPFVLSFCPPGGIVCDIFTGTGTTPAVAVRHGRRFVGCDLRPSQTALALRRLETETPLDLFAEHG